MAQNAVACCFFYGERPKKRPVELGADGGRAF